MTNDFYKSIVHTSPIGYAFHKILCNEEGCPCDYEFLEVNTAFENFTGLKASDIIGKRAVEILPGIRVGEFDWVKVYGEIAMEGGSKEFEQYSQPLSKWYKVNVYSPEKYFFITYFIDITKEKNHLSALNGLCVLSEEFLQMDNQEIDYQRINDEFLNITAAKYAVFNLYDEDGKSFTTKAISGDKGSIKKAACLLGLKLIGKKWKHDPVRAEKIKSRTITRFSCLNELIDGVLPKPIVILLEKAFHIGEVLVIKILRNDIMLGDFTLMMEKGKKFGQDTIAQLYTIQLGMAIIHKRAEEVLHQEKIFTEAIFDSIPGFLYVYDESGKLVKWNKKHEEMTGYSAEELSHMTLDKWFEGEDAIRVSAAVAEVFRTGYGEVEADLLVKGGRKRPIRSNGVRLTLGGKNFFTGIGIDISEHKKMHAEIIEAKEYFEMMFNTNPDASIVTRLSDKRVIGVNEGFTKLFGFTRDEVIGKNSIGLYLYENIDDRNRMLEELDQKGYCNNAELSFRRKDGSLFTGLLSAKKISLNGVAHVFSNTRDITERKLAEQAIQESAFIFRSLFENMSSGAAIYRVQNNGNYGKDYIIQDFNHASLIIEGKEKSEVLGKSLSDLRPNIDQYGLIPVFQEVWKTGKSVYSPSKVYIDSNFFNWYENRVFKLPSGEIVAIYDDVTEKMVINEKLNESEQKYRQIAENISDVVWTSDLNLKTTYISPSVERLLGEPIHVHMNRTLEEKFPPDSLKKIQSILLQELEIGNNPNSDKNRTRVIEAEQYRADGSIIWVSMHTSFVRDKNGNIVSIQGVTQDITERKQAEKALEKSEKKYMSYIENTQDGVFITDENGQYIEVNTAASVITGYSKDQLLQMSIRDITTEEFLDAAVDYFGTLLKNGSMDGVLQYRHKDGSKRWWTVDAVKLTENRFLGFSRDITDRKKAAEDLFHLSYHDYLTGLYNRRFYDDEIKRLDIESELPLSIIVGDINGLKLINDALGHVEGDRLIVETARILQSCCRGDDILARTGGDEFSILLPKTDSKTTLEILRKIQTVCNLHNSNIANEILHINISLGCGTKELLEEDFRQVIKTAEDYMHQRKLLEHKSSHSTIIASFKATMLEKSLETEEHAERLVSLSNMVGMALNLPQIELGKLELLATLHDIGKVGIDDGILNKPGKLNEKEWVQMKKHPMIGYRIAMSSPELVLIAECILSHHEQWDGMGYPQNLAGSDIPLLSRILAIVDAYDAMTQDRPYRKAMTMEDAIDELKKNAGAQFDPTITSIFIEEVIGKMK